MLKTLAIFGTRPEAIKLVPILIELRKYPEIRLVICVTSQHRQMLDQVLRLFAIKPDIDLDLMQPEQTLSELTVRVISKVDEVLCNVKPDLVLVQGDTTTAMAASLTAFYHKIPVGHVEAGLRSDNIYSPFPEELNRKVTALAAAYHFAPTERARSFLIREGVRENNVYVTGNPVIDALFMVLKNPVPEKAAWLLGRTGVTDGSAQRRLILVTAHRRENFGIPLRNICMGLKSLAERNKDISILYPVHHNPNVKEPVYEILSDAERVYLEEPLEYDVMAHLMNKAHLILTDSGGIQEEAPSLGKPVLVMRTETERPEGVEAGTAKLIGLAKDNIIIETERLLSDHVEYERMAKTANPYGDGKAAKRIVDVILSLDKA
ncbi:MAG: UDP-N-acetylglucosamine 2-epimerase (non-hydrolyzing) [Planctomycetota bacterium]